MGIKACLIGVGRMGRDHAKHIDNSPYATLHSVVDPQLWAAEEVASCYGAKAFATAEEALQDPELEAVVIASQTDTHAALIAMGAEAGKPVFCEKPIDLNLERIDHCLEVVERCKTPLLVGFNRRFDPSYQSFQEQLRSGRVGSIEILSISSRDHALPQREFLKNSGGLFRDMMIHDFDMARWLLNEEPTQVYAVGSCLVDPTISEFGDLDTAMVILKTASGALCHINNSRRAVYGYDQRLEAFGAEGMLRAKNLAPTTVEFAGGQGVSSDPYHPSFPQRYREAYQIEIDHFFRDVVRDGKEPMISGEDGRRAIVIADAAQKSFETGEPVAIAPMREALCV